MKVLSDKESLDLYKKLNSEFSRLVQPEQFDKESVIGLIPRLRNLRDFTTNTTFIDGAQFRIARLYEKLGEYYWNIEEQEISKNRVKITNIGSEFVQKSSPPPDVTSVTQSDNKKITKPTTETSQETTSLVAACSNCGEGTFDLCDRKECHEISDHCFFKDEGIFNGNCYLCRQATSCSDFNTDYKEGSIDINRCEDKSCLSIANNGKSLDCVYDKTEKKCKNRNEYQFSIDDYVKLLGSLDDSVLDTLNTYTAILARLDVSSNNADTLKALFPGTSDTNSLFDSTCNKDSTNKVTGKATEVCINELPRTVGYASWYGPGFDGRKTANGEIYEMDDVTAAMHEIPFNTLVKVTNLENDKSVVVRVNDRGPYRYIRRTGKFVEHPTRIIDLSKGAAEKLDMVDKGVVKVKLELA